MSSCTRVRKCLAQVSRVGSGPEFQCCGPGSGRIRNFFAGPDQDQEDVLGSESRSDLLYTVIWIIFANFSSKCLINF